ncbi:hypothetical protein GJAV_G00230530 [Gymnothorax javanicus]|nr:hypothetical protein GJAV_G00230530 [Gymnothorax javanicus]
MLHPIWILYAVLFTWDAANTSEYHHIPRIILTERDIPFRRHSRNGTHTRTELMQGPHNASLYVGGHRTLSFVDFQTPNQSKEVILFENNCRNQNSEGSCEYDITILHAIEGGTKILVCGTNGIRPVCCEMTNSNTRFGSCSASTADGIAPFSVKEKAPSIYIEDELYTTANLYSHGDGVGIRRHFGPRGNISSHANKTAQRFVAIAQSGPRDDPLQDRIYAFLLERNLEKHPDADQWVPRVIQICKADRGGTKQILERLWTSLLSARLHCGRHFSKLLDVDVLYADNWRDSKVYALFTNIWGMRAVCVYTMGAIDNVFMKSEFKHSGGSTTKGWNRMCVANSQSLSGEELNQRKNNQEMKDWIKPGNNGAPFMVSHRRYRHIRADSVTGRSDVKRTVIFLSLDSGKVHKVLEQEGPPFVIAELQPFTNRTHIENMLLQSSTKKLYVSSSDEVVELDLRNCMIYGRRCEDCVQARDPYCGWDGTKCTAATSDTVQDVEQGNYSICEEEGKPDMHAIPRKVNRLPPLAKYVLQCPIESGHAYYSWQHQGRRTECLHAERQCLLLIENMSPQLEGNHSCVSLEGGFQRTLVQYQLLIENKQAKPGSSRRFGSGLDVLSCLRHGKRCKDCVQAKDPYCTWDGTRCTAASSDTAGAMKHGDSTVCELADTSDEDKLDKVYSISPAAKYVLMCPIESGYANYSWQYQGKRTECLQSDGMCLLLIENMTPQLEGNYSCIFSDGDIERTVVQYEVRSESKAAGPAPPSVASVFLLLILMLLN